jgi:hypothetical protein
MITNTIAEQVAVIQKATAKATRSRKAALQFMKEAGLGEVQSAPNKHLKEHFKVNRSGH